MNTDELRAEAQMVVNDAGGEPTTRAALLNAAADEIDRLRWAIANTPLTALPDCCGYRPTEPPTPADMVRRPRTRRAAFTRPRTVTDNAMPPVESAREGGGSSGRLPEELLAGGHRNDADTSRERRRQVLRESVDAALNRRESPQ